VSAFGVKADIGQTACGPLRPKADIAECRPDHFQHPSLTRYDATPRPGRGNEAARTYRSHRRSSGLASARAGVPTIGFLGTDEATWSPWTAAFVDRLRQLGWIDGRTVAIEFRWSQGRAEHAAEIAAEFVRLKVDVIVTAGPAVTTAKQATTVIPIVFALANDPIRSGLVESLAHPGGNITGLSVQSPDLVGKRLTLLREAVPKLRRLAIMLNAAFSEAVFEMDEVQATARSLGIEVTPLEIRQAEDIGPTFEAVETKADALYVTPDALVTANRTRIITFALAGRLPTIHSAGEWVRAGGFMSYGPKYRRDAAHCGEYRHKSCRAPPTIITK
jgi:ABC-type uncharacterized transport system substrate-binding protein